MPKDMAFGGEKRIKDGSENFDSVSAYVTISEP